MGQMIDAVNPANIPPDFDGRPALRITVLADPAGQCFDSERGNAGVDEVAKACSTAVHAGRWVVAYTNGDNHPALTTALAGYALGWRDAASFPAPGVYLWATDPTGTPHTRVTWADVEPVAVQWGWFATHDLSATYPTFGAEVAGYIDGPASKWPAEAWSRFVPFQPQSHVPVPAPPAPSVITEVELILITKQSAGAVATFDGSHKVHVTPAEVDALKAKLGEPVQVSDGFYDSIPDAAA
jgi:hypothetical protein